MKKLLLIISLFYSTALFAQLDSIDSPLFRKINAEKDSILLSNMGKPYPSFSATTLENEPITEQVLLGKVTLINCWFEGCAPCIAELGALSSLFHRYKDNPAFQLLSFSRDYPETAKSAVHKFQIPYPVCPVSTNEIYQLNFSQGFPTNIIVDQKGCITYLKSGGSTSKEGAEKYIQLLEQKMLELMLTQDKVE